MLGCPLPKVMPTSRAQWRQLASSCLAFLAAHGHDRTPTIAGERPDTYKDDRHRARSEILPISINPENRARCLLNAKVSPLAL